MISQWIRRLISREASSPPPAAVAATPRPNTGDTPRYPPADTGLVPRNPQEILQANADLLERLRLHAATDPAQFQSRFVGPLLRLAEHINVLPATATSLFSGEMGLFRACLEAAFFAFQASDGRIFTGAEGVERRHALESRWRYLCFLAAMFYPLGRTFERIAVTGPRGEVWKRHFSGLTAWAEKEGVERVFVSWGASDSEDCIGPSNATLLVLPAVAGPENLQMLEDGEAELVAALYQLAIGEPGSSRIAHQVVKACWERIARREAARRPQAFGRLTSGTHQGPYLAGALRALVDGGVWKVNAAALRGDRDGLYLEWPLAAAESQAETGDAAEAANAGPAVLEQAIEEGESAQAQAAHESAPVGRAAPTRQRGKRVTGGGGHEDGQPVGGKLREAPEVRYSDLVPEDIRTEIGTALQVELLGKIVKAWRDRGENSTVMRRIDSGAAIEFNFLATQILNVPSWVDCMARVGLIYAPPQTPGLRIQKVPIPEGRPPVQAVVLSNLACRRLGL